MPISKPSSLWSDIWSLKSVVLTFGLFNYVLWVSTLVLCSTKHVRLPTPLDIYAWSIGQSFATLGLFPPISKMLTQKAWDSFASTHNGLGNVTTTILLPTDIPTLNVPDFIDKNAKGAEAAIEFLQSTYGMNWMERPLLLKGLWAQHELTDPSRRLSPQGLLEMKDVSIPYFTDATVPGALKPDAEASVSEIVSNMVHQNKPHKIGSQFLVQNHPNLLHEVAPCNGFLARLFGNHFSEEKLNMGGLPNKHSFKIFGMQLPGTTTVPVFVANSNKMSVGTDDNICQNPSPSVSDSTCSTSTYSSPVTGLHCEPIANVATQLSGSRTWTLVDPIHSWKLKPAISNDGRAFFPSWIDMVALERVPRYEVTTHAGDALWLPTWTYHKVDYVYHGDDGAESGDDIQKLSIGASLFHFRPVDFVRRNPLFAVLLIPSLIKELAGIKTQ